MSEPAMKAPFVYFGGKREIASLVWRRFGDCTNYAEPFAGSCAVLLARPRPFDGVETVNDLNGYVTNFWRAVKTDPEGVVEHCDWPVNELDLHARHRWLVLSDDAIAFRERMRVDPDYFDPKIAGWWCWGACCWIGSGWCACGASEVSQLPKLHGFGSGCVPQDSGTQPDLSQQIAKLSSADGVPSTPSAEWQQRPVLDGIDRGIHSKTDAALSAQVPRLTNDVALRAGPHLNEQVPLKRGTCSGTHGAGVNAANDAKHKKRPRVPREGSSFLPGVRGRPQLADAYDVGRGVNSQGSLSTCDLRREWLLDWFRRLQDRLRLTRVCCGHWSRICDSDSTTTRLGTTAVFLDPPYPLNRSDNGKKSRAGKLYHGDDNDLNKLRDEVLAYCVVKGNSPQMRLALACYEGDGYEALEMEGWRVESWKANGGYGNRGKQNKNARRERLYFSPHCCFMAGLFDSEPT